jgi:hypothetical protein
MRLFLLSLIFSSAIFAEEKATSKNGLILLAERLLGKNAGDRFFYYPTRTGPYAPDEYGFKFEDVTFASEDGVKLHGWFMKARGEGKPKGTVVFSHGNAGAVGHHIGFVTWMIEAGYQVLLYDYRGYGKSEGKLDREGMLKDVRGAFAYIKTRKDVDQKKLISYGHSLGGSKSIAALGQKSVIGLRAVISLAGFASYKDMARIVGGDLGADLVSDDHSARDFVEKLSPVPLMIVHGKNDNVVPIGQGEILFKNAEGPKTFFKVEKGGHNNALAMNDGAYQKKVLAWLDEVLK